MRISIAAAVTLTATLALVVAAANALGSAATIAVIDDIDVVCGVMAEARTIQCAALNGSGSFSMLPNASFDSVSGGGDFFCGLRSGGRSLFCWNAGNGSDVTDLARRRIYNGSDRLTDVSVGVDQVAAGGGEGIRFWRGGGKFPTFAPGEFRSLTSGRGFCCAISSSNGSVVCWGASGDGIQRQFLNVSMSTIVAGDSHVCGIDTEGVLLCKGSNFSGQSNAPSGYPFEFSNLALGTNHSCAIKQPNGTVLCWGGATAGGSYAPLGNTSFEVLVAGGNLTCGLTTMNFSVVCWSPDRNRLVVPLPRILPGICTADSSSCKCGEYPDSNFLCSGEGIICYPCGRGALGSAPSPIQVSPPPPTSKGTSKLLLAYAIVGSVGSFAGICALVYCLWAGVCHHQKIHNSVQPTIAAAGNRGSNGSPPIQSPFASLQTRSRIFHRQSLRPMSRQRSGPSRAAIGYQSSAKGAEEFSLADLAAATNSFSLENKIGSGSFGTVYRGKLADGREVAIKRSEHNPKKTKKLQDKDTAFDSELAFLSRLHHKHLVGLMGFCEEEEERLLVYEYMSNGAFSDHLHVSSGGQLDSWKIRIKVLLDAARGIEYLHDYAVPPIIHRDIKSSNILLDGNWVARVSDFGLSLAGPPPGGNGQVPVKAAGTVGYMDPEYYGTHQLTTKSDVYGLGVVMIEALTGRRAIFKAAEGEGEGSGPRSVVDFAVPSIESGDVARVLDPKVRPAQPRLALREAEAVELVAYTAARCVRLEGRERPAAADVVGNLECALALLEDSSGSMSSASIRSVD